MDWGEHITENEILHYCLDEVMKKLDESIRGGANNGSIEFKNVGVKYFFRVSDFIQVIGRFALFYGVEINLLNYETSAFPRSDYIRFEYEIVRDKMIYTVD